MSSRSGRWSRAATGSHGSTRNHGVGGDHPYRSMTNSHPPPVSIRVRRGLGLRNVARSTAVRARAQQVSSVCLLQAGGRMEPQGDRSESIDAQVNRRQARVSIGGPPAVGHRRSRGWRSARRRTESGYTTQMRGGRSGSAGSPKGATRGGTDGVTTGRRPERLIR